MEKRININGIWYIQENPNNIEENTNDGWYEPTSFLGCVIENTQACFEASILADSQNNICLDTLSIEYTDKREKPWKTDVWDNVTWMKECLKNNPESLEELDILGPQTRKFYLSFLKYLEIEKKWL